MSGGDNVPFESLAAVVPQDPSAGSAPRATLARMYVDPYRRAAAARLLLDAVTSLDLEDHGTSDAEARILLALEPLGLNLDASPETTATLAAAVDLLWFLTFKQAQTAGVSQEELVSNIREHVLPAVYPDVYGGS